ncbi:MAG: NrsF family protein [Sphingomonas sp.]
MAPSLDLDRLADELTPVRRLRPAGGALAVAAATGLAAVLTSILIGPRPDLAEGAIHPMFLMRAGLLFLLGAASLVAVIGMARPAVGNHRNDWRWALAAAALVPMAAIVIATAGGPPLAERIYPSNGAQCLLFTLGGGLVIGAALTLWLRHGAPTSPERAGLLVGLASGSFAAFAYSLHCPHNDLVYIGLWYTLAVALVTALGRLAIPPLIRW